MKELFELKKRDNGEEYICFRDDVMQSDNELYNLYEKTSDILHDIEAKEDTRYQIVSDAYDYLTDNKDNYDKANEDKNVEFASVYIQDRLNYLTNSNQDEITEFVRSYAVDIQTACAIWYDEQVKNAIYKLTDGACYLV